MKNEEHILNNVLRMLTFFILFVEAKDSFGGQGVLLNSLEAAVRSASTADNITDYEQLRESCLRVGDPKETHPTKYVCFMLIRVLRYDRSASKKSLSDVTGMAHHTLSFMSEKMKPSKLRSWMSHTLDDIQVAPSIESLKSEDDIGDYRKN